MMLQKITNPIQPTILPENINKNQNPYVIPIIIIGIVVIIIICRYYKKKNLERGLDMKVNDNVFIIKRDGKGKIGKIIKVSEIDPKFKFLILTEDGNEYWKEENSISPTKIPVTLKKKKTRNR